MFDYTKAVKQTVLFTKMNITLRNLIYLKLAPNTRESFIYGVQSSFCRIRIVNWKKFKYTTFI